jgi:hypothetical protein
MTPLASTTSSPFSGLDRYPANIIIIILLVDWRLADPDRPPLIVREKKGLSNCLAFG